MNLFEYEIVWIIPILIFLFNYLVCNQGEEAGQGNEKCRCITEFRGGDQVG